MCKRKVEQTEGQEKLLICQVCNAVNKAKKEQSENLTGMIAYEFFKNFLKK